MGISDITATLVFPIIRLKDQDLVLLGRKTRKLGKGLLNGWGGKVEEGEKLRMAAVRELKEESGFIAEPKDLKYVGKIAFYTQDEYKRVSNILVHIFLLYKWNGCLRLGNGMERHGWWSTNCLPLKDMMPADKHWVPLIFKGLKVEGYVLYGPEQKDLLYHEIRLTERLGGIE